MTSLQMVCFKIPEDLSSEDKDRSDGLCPACHQIFDDSFFFSEHDDEDKCRVLKQKTVHFHTKFLYHSSKPECPGCRLILSFFTPKDPHDKSLEQDITLRPKMFDLELEMNHGTFVNFGSAMEVLLTNHGYLSKAGTILVAGEKNNPLQNRNPPQFAALTSAQGRLVSPMIDLRLVKGWMQFCNANHKECRPSTQLTHHAFRLIDLTHWKCVNASPNDSYVALSYVWGPDTMPALTKKTLPSFSVDGGLQQVSIPRTIRDAMHFARDIGHRYIWVDSFCILQDDDNDKAQQLPIMHKIYGNADLVIVAAMGDSAHVGLPGIGTGKRNSWQQSESIGKWHFVTAGPAVNEVVSRTSWDSRGWTFQEAFVARRIIVFTEYQLFWICQDSTWREDTRLESQSRTSEGEGSISLWGHVSNDACRPAQVCRTSDYCRNVEAFSRRVFTVESDVLWAYIGILESRAVYFPRGYIWCLPYEILDAALLWTVPEYRSCDCSPTTKDSLHEFMRRGTHYTLPYPSWSWLSVRNNVKYQSPCGSIVSEVSWHDALNFESQRTRSVHGAIMTYIQNMFGGKNWKPNVILQSQPFADSVMDYGFLHFAAMMANVIVTSSDTKWVDPLKPVADLSVNNESRDDLIPKDKAMHSTVKILSWMQYRAKEFLRTVRHVSATIFAGLRYDSDPEGIALANANICLPSGEILCQLRVPVNYFGLRENRVGQIILLSSNAVEKTDKRCVISTSPLDCGNIVHAQGCEHIESHNIMLIEWKGNIAYRRALGRISKQGWAKLSSNVKKKDIVLG